MGLKDIFRTFYSIAAEHRFFSSTHGDFSRIHHILGHKTSVNIFKKLKSCPKSFWKLGINSKRNFRKESVQ
jgi:hypothetical protein